MAETEQQVTIDNLAGGGAAELITAAFEQVSENIQDQNTEIKQVREITLKISIRPMSRDSAMSKIRVQTKLAPAKDIETPSEKLVVIG